MLTDSFHIIYKLFETEEEASPYPSEYVQQMKNSSFRVRFNDSRFYFTISVEVFTNPISTENTYFTYHIERALMVYEPANRYQIIGQSLNWQSIDNFHHHPFLCQPKVL